MTARPLRVLMYAQSLSGAGHFVRTHAIATALATRHEVMVLDGGLPVPRPAQPGIRRPGLPRMTRRDGVLAAVEPGVSLDHLLARRRDTIAGLVAEFRPDVAVVEHYPFSKWELEAEIGFLLARARAANPALRALCSARDLPGQTRHEDCSPAAWNQRVVDTLNRDFQGLMIHGNEAWTPLARSLPARHELTLPVTHTGIVAEPLPPPAPEALALAPFILVSSGGRGLERPGGGGLGARVREAWALLGAQGLTRDWNLILFDGLQAPPPRPAAAERGFHHRPFGPDYLGWLRAASGTVSHAGYNTCANVLAARVPALLVPDPVMSDQGPRCEVMAGLGAATVAGPAAGDGSLAGGLAELLAGRGRRAPVLDLAGAERARDFIEALAG